MNKRWVSVVVMLFVLMSFVGITSAQDTIAPPPTIYATPQFEVEKKTHTYAQGLSHDDWGSESAEIIDLVLDVYEPIDAPDNRPAILMIHGGGYISGSRTQGAMTTIANHFAERGWVAMSIDYRLAGDKGTLPLYWLDTIDRILPRSLQNQALAMYPANRDAKAAIRWLYANADAYQINTNYITVGGGSAGALISIVMGVTDEAYFRDELSLDDDPTLETANLDQPAQIHTIIDYWGSGQNVNLLEIIEQISQFDETDAPIMIVHGTEDKTVEYSLAEELRDEYEANEVPYAFYPLEGQGHSAWRAEVDGMTLAELAFEFVVEQQALTIAE